MDRKEYLKKYAKKHSHKYRYSKNNHCLDCGKLIDNRATKCQQHSNINKGGWNKDLTMETDERVKQISKSNIGREAWNRGIEFKHNGSFKEGERHLNWKGGIYNRDGYRLILCKNHPNADFDGYVKEHTLVMEKKLGRYIQPGEEIHHIDFNRSNNIIDNLYLFKSKGEHTKYHSLLKSFIKEALLNKEG